MKGLLIIFVSSLAAVGGVLAGGRPPDPKEGVADLKRSVIPYTSETFPAHNLKKRGEPLGWTTGTSVRNSVLKITNDYRYLHDVDPLVWNTTLASYALSKGRNCFFGSSGGPYGENIAGTVNSNNPAWLVWFLHDENSKYDYENPVVNDRTTKHFTQLIWGSTTQIGCAWIVGCPELYYQLWCEFSPKGNVGNRASYISNVKRWNPTKPVPTEPPLQV